MGITVSIHDSDAKTVAVYLDVDDARHAEIMHALSGSMPPVVIPEVSEVKHYAQETGACLCTSFSQDVSNGRDNCVSCGHDTHNTRVHCGVMTHALERI